MVCARGSSHRTLTDAELIRWDAPFARVATRREIPGLDPLELDVTLVREGPAGGRKRIRVNGVPRRAAALAGLLRVVVFAPEEMLLVAGPPSLRRGMLDALAGPADARPPGRSRRLRRASSPSATPSCARSARARRRPTSCRTWDARLVDTGAAVLGARQRVLAEVAAPLAAAHAEIAADEGILTITYESNVVPAPGEAVPRRARPPACRHGGEGGVERSDARRAAPGRPGLPTRRARPGHVRIAGAAADRDPRPQAGRARPPGRP